TIDVPDTSTWLRAEVYYKDAGELRKELQPFCDQIASWSGEQVAYCTSRLAVVAMTSPIYFESQQFDPATTLVYDGATSAKVGSSTTLSAVLTGSDGPISGAGVEFSFHGTTYDATTNDAGRASATVKVNGPPGSYEVVSSFGGSDRYSPTQDRDTFTVTSGH
ncbi:MAG TPA: Ig-like domain-containing protein, partial [Actinomycetota bacterium]|nr:Ig-like domain-containing protein [Actinomycetota bacterium]